MPSVKQRHPRARRCCRFKWCRRLELNQHAQLRAGDFKSPVSAFSPRRQVLMQRTLYDELKYSAFLKSDHFPSSFRPNVPGYSRSGYVGDCAYPLALRAVFHTRDEAKHVHPTQQTIAQYVRLLPSPLLRTLVQRLLHPLFQAFLGRKNFHLFSTAHMLLWHEDRP